MQKLFKKREKKRGWESPGLPLGLGDPQPPAPLPLGLRPQRQAQLAVGPSQPAHSPFPVALPPPPVPLTGQGRARPSPSDPPRRRRPSEGIRLAPPRLLDPRLHLHHPLHLLFPPHPVSLARLSRARSPPFSVVTAATATASLRRLVVKLRRGRLRRLVPPGGAGKHR